MLAALIALAGLVPTQATPGWRGAERELELAAEHFERSVEQSDRRALAELYQLVALGRLLDERGRVAEALGRARAKAKDPLLLDHLGYLESEAALAAGDVDGAEAARAALGLLRDGLVLGPFDNAAGAGHSEVYPPEQGLDLDQPVQGRDRPLRWRAIGEAARQGFLPLSQLVVPSADATAYVLTAVHAKSDTPAALRVGSTDSVKAWVGGRLVLDVPRERRAALDQDSVPVVFPAGWTPLLLKVSWTGKGGRAWVRIGAPAGGPARELSVSSSLDDVRAALAPRKAASKPAKHTVARVEDAIAAPKTAEEHRLAASLASALHLYDAKKLPSVPVTELEAAMALAPRDPWPRYLAAEQLRAKDAAQAAELLDAALALDPRFAPAQLALAELAEGSERSIAARAATRRAAEDPSFGAARRALAALYARSPLERTRARALLEEVPPERRSARHLAALAQLTATMGDKRASEAAAREALARDFSLDGPRAILLGLAEERGDTGAALALVGEQIRLDPHAVGPRLVRARLIAGGPEGPAAAREALARDARSFPDNLQIQTLDAELALRAGDRAAAVAALDRALAVNPQLREVRRHKAALTGQRGELEDELSADPLEVAARTPPNALEESYGAAVLLERTAVQLYDNGSSSRFVQSLTRLDREAMKDLVRASAVHFSPSRESVEILSAERIRPSGEIVRASRIDEDGPRGKVSGMYVDQRWKRIEFEDLAPGDLVHLRYRVDTVGQNMFGGFFGELVPIEGRFPKRVVEVFAQAPEGRPLYPGAVRSPMPTISVDGGVERASWRFTEVAPIDPEPMSPAYAELASTVGVSTYSSWEDLGRWFAHLFRDQMELDAETREAGRRAVAGAKDEAEKVRRLYAYVVKNTRYVGIELGIHGWKPFKASEVHRRRYGDCKDKATLLAALLEDNGVEATLALVRTVDRGPFPASHATMWAFNHAITYVPSLDLYLDGTAERSGSGELPYQDQGAFALVVYPDGRVKLDAPPESTAAENLNRSSYDAIVQPDGTLTLSGEERFFGARASAIRAEHAEPRTRKETVEHALSEIAPGAAVETIEFSDLEDLEASPFYRYQATLPRYADAQPDKLVVPLTLFPHRVADVYGDLVERKTDLVATFPWSTQNVIRYRLPPGASIASLPEGVTIDTPHLSLVQKIRPIPGGYETDDTVTLKSRRVPRADYPAFREALLAVDRALERKVVIAR